VGKYPPTAGGARSKATQEPVSGLFRIEGDRGERAALPPEEGVRPAEKEAPTATVGASSDVRVRPGYSPASAVRPLVAAFATGPVEWYRTRWRCSLTSAVTSSSSPSKPSSSVRRAT
jgi:hypothetical protein